MIGTDIVYIPKIKKMINIKSFINFIYTKKEQEIAKLKGINTGIDFGSQIRSYVLEPYKMVKDTRSGYETSEADKVLDGDIKPFIESILKMK